MLVKCERKKDEERLRLMKCGETAVLRKSFDARQAELPSFGSAFHQNFELTSDLTTCCAEDSHSLETSFPAPTPPILNPEHLGSAYYLKENGEGSAARTATSTMLYEDLRGLHEDIERLEQAVADRVLEDPKHVSITKI
jgi:hypothetical protein